MMLAETYMELVTNFPHWAFELTAEIATGIVFSPLWAFLIRRHDRRKHPIDQLTPPTRKESR